MADPLASERAMTFSEPPIYPSSSYVSVQYSERPSDQQRWWGPSERFSITIRSPGQNEFFDANKMRLQFSVLSVVEPAQILGGARSAARSIINPTAAYPNADPFVTPSGVDCAGQWLDISPWEQQLSDDSQFTRYYANGATLGIPAATKSDAACMLPGAPSWGCPFFAAVRVAIPGVPLESFLTTDVESQWMVSTRLLCASGTGSWDPEVGKTSFKIAGEPELAGARSVVDRLNGVSCGLVWTDRTTNSGCREPFSSGIETTATVIVGDTSIVARMDPTRYRGTLQHYSIPLSLFCYLFNSTSNLLPLGFYSTSADTVSFTFETASVNAAINNLNVDRPEFAGPATYYIIDPCISATKLQISSPPILAGVEALYRGQMSIPLAPGVNVPLAFVMKFINYVGAIQRINAASGYFSLDLPANQPSVRGVALRFCSERITAAGLYNGRLPANYFLPVSGANNPTLSQPWALMNSYSDGYGQWNGRYLLNLVPVMRNLQLRIASFRCPLDPLSDTQWAAGQPPRGLSTDPFSSLGMPTAIDSTSEGPLTLTYQPVGTAAVAPFTAFALSTGVDVTSSFREAARLYKQGKHLYSPFAVEENPHDNALSPFFLAETVGDVDSAQQAFFTGYHLRGRDKVAVTVPVAVQTPVLPATPIDPANAIETYTWFNQMFNQFSAHVAGGVLSSYRTVCGQQGTVRYSGGVKNGTNLNSAIERTANCWTEGTDKVPLPQWTNTGLFVLPLETIGAVYNHRDDVFALRGLDLRSIGQVNVSGEIMGVSRGAAGGSFLSQSIATWDGGAVVGESVGFTRLFWGLDAWTIINPAAFTTTTPPVATRNAPMVNPPATDPVTCGSWAIRGYLAYDQEHVLLPGRIDVDAQFAMTPTGATSIPSGGAPAM